MGHARRKRDLKSADGHAAQVANGTDAVKIAVTLAEPKPPAKPLKTAVTIDGQAVRRFGRAGAHGVLTLETM